MPKNDFLTREEKEILFNSLRNSGDTELKRAFFKHAVVYGDYVDVYAYKDVKMIFNGKDNSRNRRQSGAKRDDSLSRARTTLYRLVRGNVYKHGRFKPIFGTYTFAEQVFCLDKASTMFKRYIARLSRYVGKRVLYVAVPEKHESGAWHLHVIFFNLPKLNLEINDKLWKQGNTAVNMKFVKGVNGVRDVASYISKYLSKSYLNNRAFNKKMYYCSRGLIRPIHIYSRDAIDDILKSGTIRVLSSFEAQTFTQTKYHL